MQTSPVEIPARGPIDMPARAGAWRRASAAAAAKPFPPAGRSAQDFARHFTLLLVSWRVIRIYLRTNLTPAGGPMTLDAALLSRFQWAWVIAWHILLPAFTVGLASYIALLEGLYYFTGEQVWFRISGFWTKIFAVSFGMGVVSGIIMPFQFGTNWSRFTDATADVLSPMMAYEGLMAFFLESTFLGVL